VRFLLIGLGGAAGTLARYLLDGAAARLLGLDFPYGTLVINVLGSFLIGVIQETALVTGTVPETLRVTLTVGVMGGFTTYSAFSLQTVKLVEGGATLAAALYVVLTTGLCLLVCALGIEAARALAR
jgi:fluoride exporter